MRVHYVEGYLHSIELETVLVGDLKRVFVNVWALVPSKADIAQLSSRAGFYHNFHCTARRKNAFSVVHTDKLVKLQQVEVIGLQSLERLVQLLGGRLAVAAINLRHEGGFLPITVPQRLTHALFAYTAVVVPTVVKEVHATIERGTHDADGLLLGRYSKVVTPNPKD